VTVGVRFGVVLILRPENTLGKFNSSGQLVVNSGQNKKPSVMPGFSNYFLLITIYSFIGLPIFLATRKSKIPKVTNNAR
jgi:hypothetical protein